MNPRPNWPVVLHLSDVFVDENAIYGTDWSGVGPHILEYAD
jgi:hypothetical protein